jgi:hypothetical protein
MTRRLGSARRAARDQLEELRDADDTRLADLFRADERVTFRSEDARTPWLVPAALATFALSAIGYFVFRIADLDPPYLLVLAMSVGAVAVRLAARSVKEAGGQRTAATVRRRPVTDMITAAGLYEGGDGMLESIRRWDRRLEWGATAPERYALTVAPRVAELAEERLRQRYGFTLAGDPDRARQVLGEVVWAALHPRDGWAPTVRQLADVVVRLDAVGRDQI